MRILTDEWIQKIQKKRSEDEYYAYLIDHAVIDRARDIAVRPGIRHEDDRTIDWWRCLSRVEFTALAHFFSPGEERIRLWLHDALMEIATMPDDQWIGPFFRPRLNPPQGMLETSAILVTVAQALNLCPDVLNEEEQALMLKKVREVGLLYSRNWISARETEGKFGDNNWSVVLLCGCAYAGALLEDEETLRFVVDRFNRLCDTMNEDYYGEPIGYWSYAAGQFASIQLLFEAVRPDLARQLRPAKTYASILPWYAAQMVGTIRPEAAKEVELVRWVNFSDSSAIGRPGGTLVAAIASRKEEMPELAALAAQVFFASYPKDTLYPPEGGRLGNWPTVSIWLTLLYPDFADPKDAPSAPAVQRFGNGLTVIKGENLNFFSLAGSSVPDNCVGHRHADQGAIFAAYGGIVLLDDSGCCCYRLPLYIEGKQDTAHSLPLFWQGEQALHQRILDHKDAHLPPLNRDAGHELGEDSFKTTSDMGGLYPQPLQKVLRTVWAEKNHLVLITDEWAADAPVHEETKFVFNNRNMAMEWRISGNECRMVREKVGVRVISLDGCTPRLGYGTLHDANNAGPAAPTQGKQGSAYEMSFGLEEETAQGQRRFLLIFDDEDALDGWQAVQDGGEWIIRDPNGRQYARTQGTDVVR